MAMRVIGFRAEPGGVNWAIVEGTTEQPILVAADRSAAPVIYKEAEALAWYRQHVLDLFDRYDPKAAAVRYAEPTARGAGTEAAKRRSRLEGVLLEASGSRRVPAIGEAMVTIKSKLGANAKAYLVQPTFRQLDWSRRSPECREAILVAATVLE